MSSVVQRGGEGGNVAGSEGGHFGTGQRGRGAIERGKPRQDLIAHQLLHDEHEAGPGGDALMRELERRELQREAKAFRVHLDVGAPLQQRGNAVPVHMGGKPQVLQPRRQKRHLLLPVLGMSRGRAAEQDAFDGGEMGGVP